MFEAIAFYVFGALCLCAFLIVVMSNNILYALTSLAFGMILVSGLFFLLHADFLGVVQITIYTTTKINSIRIYFLASIFTFMR